MSVQLSVLNVKALVGAYSVIVKLLVIFGNLRFKLYYLFLFLPRSATTTWSRFPFLGVSLFKRDTKQHAAQVVKVFCIIVNIF